MPRRNDISKVLVIVLALGTFAVPCDFEIKGPAVTVDHTCGTVMDVTGKPIAGMNLAIRHWKRRSKQQLPVVAMTSADHQGRFDFAVIRPGKYLMSTTDQDWQLAVVFEVAEDERDDCQHPMYVVSNVSGFCGGGKVSMKRPRSK